MGKDEILDPVDHTSIMRKRHFTRLLLFPILSTFALFSACAFPRIMILKDPLKPEEHLNLGVIYEKEGEFDHAIREYRLASKRLPIAYLYIGNVYFQRKEWIKAEKTTESRSNETPRKPMPITILHGFTTPRERKLMKPRDLP